MEYGILSYSSFWNSGCAAFFYHGFAFHVVLCEFVSDLFENWIESWLIQMWSGLTTQNIEIIIS